MRFGLASYPDWSKSIEDMIGFLLQDCCLRSYNRIYQRLNKVRNHLRRWSMTRLHGHHIMSIETVSTASKSWSCCLRSVLSEAHQSVQSRLNECSPSMRIQDLGTHRDLQGLSWSSTERHCIEISDISYMIHFGAYYSPALERFLTEMQMALDSTHANTPNSASFPKYKVIGVCSYTL